MVHARASCAVGLGVPTQTKPRRSADFSLNPSSPKPPRGGEPLRRRGFAEARGRGLLRRVLVDIDNYVFPRFVVPLVSFLPARLAYGVALVRGDLRFWALKGTFREAEYCMEMVFGRGQTREERTRALRDMVRLDSCKRVDEMRLLGNGKAFTRLLKVRGLERLADSLKAGRGAILCGGHLGSSRCCFSAIGALGFPVTLIARWNFPDDGDLMPLKRAINRIVQDMPAASHLRGPNIERRPENLGVALQAARVIQQNEAVGIMLDHQVFPWDRSKPIQVDFLGKRATFVPGAAALAQTTGAPLFLVRLVRSRDWRHQTLEVTPPTQGLDSMDLFLQYIGTIGEAIRERPGFWEHWKLGRAVTMGILPRSAVEEFRRSRQS